MQGNTKGKLNIFIVIGIFIAVVVAGVLYEKRDKSSAELLVNMPTATSSAPIDSAFLSALLQLKKIELKKNIFEDKAWKSLRDFSRPLNPQDTYRPNPFAPLDASTTVEQR